MNESKLSVRYAKALFLTAMERKIVDRIREDMKVLTDTCDAVPEFLDMIQSPVISDSRKKKLVSDVFKDIFHQLSLEFIYLVLDNNRGNQLQYMSRRLLDLYKEDHNITELSLTTPVKLDKKTKEQMIDLVHGHKGQKIEMIETVDRDMLGGFILKIDDRQMDASVGTQLKRLKRELITKEYTKKI
jgi:F-type H+-transporting ATPase subunit delta